MTGTDAGGFAAGLPAVVLERADARVEDWPAYADSLAVEASADGEAESVVLEYSWDGGLAGFELPLTRAGLRGGRSRWACLLAVPKGTAEVRFSLKARRGSSERACDDGGRPFVAVFVRGGA